jgi:hypothetical protein
MYKYLYTLWMMPNLRQGDCQAIEDICTYIYICADICFIYVLIYACMYKYIFTHK